jgi:hypothetical protein
MRFCHLTTVSRLPHLLLNEHPSVLRLLNPSQIDELVDDLLAEHRNQIDYCLQPITSSNSKILR